MGNNPVYGNKNEVTPLPFNDILLFLPQYYSIHSTILLYILQTMARYRNLKGNKALNDLLLSRSLSRTDIARLLIIGEATINKMFINPYTITLSQYYTIAGALDLNVHILIYAVVSNQTYEAIKTEWYDIVVKQANEVMNDPYAGLMAKARSNSL